MYTNFFCSNINNFFASSKEFIPPPYVIGVKHSPNIFDKRLKLILLFDDAKISNIIISSASFSLNIFTALIKSPIYLELEKLRVLTNPSSFNKVQE